MTVEFDPISKKTRSLEERLAALGLSKRRRVLLDMLPLDKEDGVGLEVSPNFAPIVTKSDSDVLYCDYLTHEQLMAREKANPGRVNNGLWVQRSDFVWEIGKSLEECAPAGIKFDYIISSHVLEHVPDFLGYIYNMRKVLKDDGVIVFALPDIKGSGEYFRRESSPSDLLDAYLTARQWPSPAQVYDGFRTLFPFNNASLVDVTLSDVKCYFTPESCYQIAKNSITKYQDVHCWAFTKESLASTLSELKKIGVFDFEIEDLESNAPTVTGSGSEFYVKLRPIAPPRDLIKPVRDYAQIDTVLGIETLSAENATLRSALDEATTQGRKLAEDVTDVKRAFDEVVAAQSQLKAEKAELKWDLSRHLDSAGAESRALRDALHEATTRGKNALADATHAKKAFDEAVAAQNQLKAEKAELSLTLSRQINDMTAENRALQASRDQATYDVDHGKRAFDEAVAAQDQLKAEKAELEARLNGLPARPSFYRKLVFLFGSSG